MMNKISVFVGVLLASTISGFAADMDEMITDAPEAEISTSVNGIYIATRLAAAFNSDTEFDLSAPATSIINGYGDGGWAGSIAAGYRFGPTFSAELEVGYSTQSVDSHTLTALPATLTDPDAFGDTKTTYGLINLTGTYETGWALRPYLSAGVGIAKVEFDNHGVELAAPVGPLGPGTVTAMNDSDNGIAWQIGAGAILDITDKLAIEAGYRYLTVSSVSLAAVDGTAADIDIEQHQALLGVRYAF